MNFFIKLILLFFLNTSVSFAETITVKCYVDEDLSYSFLLDTQKKEVIWLDQNNQKLNVTIFPDVNKGGYLLIMGGTDNKDEKHTFIVNVVKSILNVRTNLGLNKTAKCGNKAILEPIDPYAE